MGTYNWGKDFTVVAGADLSAQQYKNVNLSGVLATSASNFFGILQNKPQSGEHATVRVYGFSKVFIPTSIGVGALLGQSGTTSGALAIVTSGGLAIGRLVFAAASGGIGTIALFGGFGEAL